MRRSAHFIRGFVAIVLFIFPFSALLPQLPPPADPIRIAVVKAEREGRWADAQKLLEDEIHKLELGEANNPTLADYLRSLSFVLSQKRDNAAATEAAQQALEIDKNAFGPTDIHILRDLLPIASFYRNRGDQDKAERALLQAVDITHRDANGDYR